MLAPFATKEDNAEQGAALDALHERKIAHNEMLYVVAAGGYVDESTRREIASTDARGISIVYWQPNRLAPPMRGGQGAFQAKRDASHGLRGRTQCLVFVCAMRSCGRRTATLAVRRVYCSCPACRADYQIEWHDPAETSCIMLMQQQSDPS